MIGTDNLQKRKNNCLLDISKMLAALSIREMQVKTIVGCYSSSITLANIQTLLLLSIGVKLQGSRSCHALLLWVHSSSDGLFGNSYQPYNHVSPFNLVILFWTLSCRYTCMHTKWHLYKVFYCSIVYNKRLETPQMSISGDYLNKIWNMQLFGTSWKNLQIYNFVKKQGEKTEYVACSFGVTIKGKIIYIYVKNSGKMHKKQKFYGHRANDR